MIKENKIYREISLACHPGRIGGPQSAGVSLRCIRKVNAPGLCIKEKAAGDFGQKPSWMTTILNNIPSSVSVLQPMGQALIVKLSPHGEATDFNVPSTWRERAERVSPSVRGKVTAETLNRNTFRVPLRSGFTMIELLVVVLIIGILAAVALPWYQQAVLKAQVSRKLADLSSLEKAQTIYNLEHGVYTTNLSAIDVQLVDSVSCEFTNGSYCQSYGLVTRGIILEWHPTGTRFRCLARTSNRLANQVCASFGELEPRTYGSYNYYNMF